MAAPGVTDIGTATTITFGTSAWTSELLNVDWDGMARGEVQTSHMGSTGWHSFIPTDLIDPGGIEVEFHLKDNQVNPCTLVPEVITITTPSGTTWAASGFATNYRIGLPFEDKMTASMTIKATDAITIT